MGSVGQNIVRFHFVISYMFRTGVVITNMRLSLGKCIRIPFWEEDVACVKEYVDSDDVMLSGVKLRQRATKLGVRVGLEAVDEW